MGTLRKAAAYSRRYALPYTRTSRKKNKSFIKVIPPQKIVKFCMGRGDLFRQGKLPFQLDIVAVEFGQIRHNALEAVRQFLTKGLDESLPGQYYFKVVPFPHHIQRENKMLTGAGADRMQTGMSRSFGKSVGKSALVHKGSSVFFFALQDARGLAIARNLMKIVKPKMPCKLSFIDRTDKVAAKIAQQERESA
jgi:large subunit ribosomal protein L10e